MFRRDAGMRYRGRIHERPVFPGNDGAADRPAAPGVTIFHHGCQASAIQQRDKAARNLRLVEKALEEIPENDLIERSLYIFYRGWGSLAPERDERIRAWVEFVETHPELERPPVSAWIPSGMAQYAWALSDQSRHVEAEVRARRVLAKYGPSPPLYLAIARARAVAGDYQAALEALAVLLDGPDPPCRRCIASFHSIWVWFAAGRGTFRPKSPSGRSATMRPRNSMPRWSGRSRITCLPCCGWLVSRCSVAGSLKRSPRFSGILAYWNKDLPKSTASVWL